MRKALALDISMCLQYHWGWFIRCETGAQHTFCQLHDTRPLLEVFISHYFQPSFFSKTICFPRVLGGFLERRIPGKNGEATLRTSEHAAPADRRFGCLGVGIAFGACTARALVVRQSKHGFCTLRGCLLQAMCES